jgi:hypothetical protein
LDGERAKNMNSAKSQALALAFLKASENNDDVEARRLLADAGNFIGPLKSFTEADAFITEAKLFMQLTKKIDIKKVLADGDDVCVFWDYTTLVPSIPVTPIAEWFKIESGKIKFIHLHFNAIPFVAAMERGEVARALQSRKAN